jgi:hypothetical protein
MMAHGLARLIDIRIAAEFDVSLPKNGCPFPQFGHYLLYIGSDLAHLSHSKPYLAFHQAPSIITKSALRFKLANPLGQFFQAPHHRSYAPTESSRSICSRLAKIQPRSLMQITKRLQKLAL